MTCDFLPAFNKDGRKLQVPDTASLINQLTSRLVGRWVLQHVCRQGVDSATWYKCKQMGYCSAAWWLGGSAMAGVSAGKWGMMVWVWEGSQLPTHLGSTLLAAWWLLGRKIGRSRKNLLEWPATSYPIDFVCGKLARKVKNADHVITRCCNYCECKPIAKCPDRDHVTIWMQWPQL